MAGTNEFLTFGNGGGSNVITQAAYAALAERTAGFATGEAVSAECNKVWRQGAYAAAALGKIIADTNRNALDDGNMAAFVANLIAALNETLTPQLPPGIYCEYAAATGTPPGKWVFANGAVVLRAGTYADLFAVIGTTYNTGGEAGDSFRLPDRRGVFCRGLDAGRGVDGGRTMGPAYQADQNKAHTHDMTYQNGSEASGGVTNHDGFLSLNADDNVANPYHNTAGVIDSDGGTEVRVKNMAARIFISY